MKTIRIKSSAYTRLGNVSFLSYAGGVKLSLEKHADVFSSPPISPDDLGISIQDLKDKSIIASDGSKTAQGARNIQRSAVTQLLMLTSPYVLGIANTKKTFEEKRAIVELAGFTAALGPN